MDDVGTYVHTYVVHGDWRRLRFTNYKISRGTWPSKVGQGAPLAFQGPVVEFNLKFGGVVRIPPQLISRSSHTYIHADGDNVKIAA